MLKILIANDGYHAHFFERVSWLQAFNNISGVSAMMYDCKNSSAFDVFNSFNPDIFIGQLYNLDEPTFRCIKSRPWLKVALRAGDWGEHDFSENGRYNVLQTSENEIKNLEKLKKETGEPSFVFCHYLQEDMNITHSLFKEKLGIDAVSIMLSGNVNAYYNSAYEEDLSCDIAFVGGYWPYKGLIIDQMLTPLCYDYKYNIKIFGNQVWPHVNQYCGFLDENRVSSLFKSAKICPNLSEPHAHRFGIEINERAFKVLLSGGFCIGDNVRSHKEIFKDGVVFADNGEEFKNLVDYYLDNPSERAKISKVGKSTVLKNHTNFHRAADFLHHLGYHDLSADALHKIQEFAKKDEQE